MDPGVSLERFRKEGPRKVATRLEMNEHGLNRLSTTIVTPEKAKYLGFEDLLKILKFSEEVNARIGLPKTDSLIIRTSYISPGKPSEPALLINNLTGNTTYSYLDEDKKVRLNSLEEFTRFLRPHTYLMIHDDNYELQMNGIHVRTSELLHGSELLFGTDALQTRELEMEKKKRPSIRINVSRDGVVSHYGMAALFSIPSTIIDKMFDQSCEYLSANGISIRMRNIDREKAKLILQRIQKDRESLLELHRIGEELHGTHAVVESRIYHTLPGGLGRRVQALDIN